MLDIAQIIMPNITQSIIVNTHKDREEDIDTEFVIRIRFFYFFINFTIFFSINYQSKICTSIY